MRQTNNNKSNRCGSALNSPKWYPRQPIKYTISSKPPLNMNGYEEPTQLPVDFSGITLGQAFISFEHIHTLSVLPALKGQSQ